jgi:cell fate (sporulation/competence/biofilm development) regulator YlbF (YheA/YmcA/DUF963 family)
MVYANVVDFNPQISSQQSAFRYALEVIKESFTSIDRFEIQLSEELRKMRDNRLFTEGGYKTFEEFCNKELFQWGGYRRVNQLLGFGLVAEVLRGTELDGVVSRESHARPLLRLVKSPEKLQETVAIAVALATERERLASESNPNPTAKDFKEAAEKVVPLPKRTKSQKSQEQLFLTGAEVKISLQGHPREGQAGIVSGDPPNHTHLFIVFPDSEQSELFAISDLDASSTPFTPRKYPKEYEEAIAQLQLQHKEEIQRLEVDIRAGLLTEAEERAQQLVHEQLAASQAIASTKALEVAKLQQKIEELESLRTLEVQNQQLQQRIGELERALENRPVQEWGNTLTKQAQKAVNAEVIRMVENLEPELHLRALATAPPSDATEALRLMALAMGNLAKALNDTQALSAAAILLKCNPTPEAIAYQVELNQMVHQAVGDIRRELQSGCDWNGFWAIASEYEAIKKAYWINLTQDERNLITLLKKEFDQEGRRMNLVKSPPPFGHEKSEEIRPSSFFPLTSDFVDQSLIPNDDSPWLLTPQSWQSGGRSCKYVKMGELSLVFNDEQWLAIPPSDTEKYINPRTWLDSWKEGKVVEGAIAHTDINKQAYEFHGIVLGVNPDLQEIRIQWQEIPDARWYGVNELRVRESNS